jgi:hypothetical protein
MKYLWLLSGSTVIMKGQYEMVSILRNYSEADETITG